MLLLLIAFSFLLLILSFSSSPLLQPGSSAGCGPPQVSLFWCGPPVAVGPQGCPSSVSGYPWATASPSSSPKYLPSRVCLLPRGIFSLIPSVPFHVLPVSSCVSFCIFLSGILPSSLIPHLVSPLTSPYVLHRGPGATLTSHLLNSKTPPSRIMMELWQYACFPATLALAVHLHRAIHLRGSQSSTSQQRKNPFWRA